jgi:hypothetical protein
MSLGIELDPDVLGCEDPIVGLGETSRDIVVGDCDAAAPTVGFKDEVARLNDGVRVASADPTVGFKEEMAVGNGDGC